MPVVSIIVPVYNVEKYLRECLDSILNQTFNDFELILIDDGSKDQSGKICDEYAKTHSNITVVHQKNQGQAAARNNGVKLSKADWIMFVDSDDLIHPQLLEFLIKPVKECEVNSSAALIERGSTISDNFFCDKEFQYNIYNTNDETISKLYFDRQSKENDVCWLVLPKLLKTSIVKKYLFVSERIFEDNEVACKWLVESGNIAVIPEAMYFYRDNPTGTMNQKFSMKKLDYLWALEQQIEFYHKLGYKRILRLVIEDYFHNAVYFGKLIVSELNDKAACKALMMETEHKMKKYSQYCDFEIDTHTKNFIIKYAHPFKFKIRKKINSFKSRF